MSDDTRESKTRRMKIMELMDQPRRNKQAPGRVRLAQRALKNASAERGLARNGGGNAAKYLAEAERLESVAAALMKPEEPPLVKSGEVVRALAGSGPPQEFSDTLSNPDQAAIEASAARADLLVSANADIVAMAVDAATSANAANSFEKMLAHQAAALHTLTMKAVARAVEFEKNLTTIDAGIGQADSVEFTRMVQTASRSSSAFQTALITLQRLQTGNSQTMTIRHVTVEAGGQAVIGNVNAGGAPTSKRGRGKLK